MDKKYIESINFIKSKINIEPDIGIVLGSGLSSFGELIENSQTVEYSEIPNFKTSTAPGHNGRFIFGKLNGKNLVCMQGRLHFYEGYAMQDTVYPIRIMKLLGVKKLIVTNAAGAINKDFSIGDIMNITDHINFLGTNPMIGKNDDDFGKRFFDISTVYDPSLIKIAKECAEKLNISLKSGIYIACTGPSFESPAEIRAFRTLGADAVGMSTVPEVITAAHCGIKVLAFSLLTNMAAGITKEKLSGDDVIEVGKKKTPVFNSLISEIIANL